MKVRDNIKLSVASHHFFPTHGGATLRFVRYLPGFRERGIDVEIVAGTPKGRKLLSSDMEQPWYARPVGEFLPVELIDGIQLHRVRLPEVAGWKRSLLFNRAVVQVCRQQGHRPDVIQILSSLRPRSIPWLIRLKRLGIAIAYAYTLATELPSDGILKRVKKKWGLRLLYQQLDSIVVNSKVLRDLLLDLGVKTQIEVIPNGVDLERFRAIRNSEERKALRSGLGMDDSHKVITTVGSVVPRKGSDFLLEAWSRLAPSFPEAHLFFVGPLFDENHPDLGDFRRKIDNLVAASGAADRVHFVGFIDNVEDYLRASDVFVFPSTREGLPNVVLEAMASGLPVVVTPFFGQSEELGQPGQQYLLVERNPEALATAIAEVLEEDGLRATFGQRARRWVEETMDVEQSLDRYATFYHSLAEKARGRRGRWRN
jgi:glycosyltransferase involved in cell wall biosynthesis